MSIFDDKIRPRYLNLKTIYKYSLDYPARCTLITRARSAAPAAWPSGLHARDADLPVDAAHKYGRGYD